MHLQDIIGATVAAAALAGTAAPAEPAAAASLKLSTGIRPTFSRSVANYTTDCRAGTTTVAITAGRAVASSIGAAKTRTGNQMATVKLKPGQRVIVRLGDSTGTTSHSIRCLPTDFPAMAATGRLPASIPMVALNEISERGRATSAGRSYYAVIIDRNGVPIWWHRENSRLVHFFVTPEGRLGFGQSGGSLHLCNLRNQLLQTVLPNTDVDAHDAVPDSGGNWLMAIHSLRRGIDLTPIGDRTRQTVLDSTIVRVPGSGGKPWTWNSADRIALTETLMTQVGLSPSRERQVDIAHLNSLAADGDDGVIAGFRGQSAVYRIRLSDGSIDWKLGGSRTARSLRVIGDPDVAEDRHLLGQHDARLQPDGTLTVFDNGSPIQVRDGGSEQRPARALRFAIDPVARTATVVEKVTDPQIASTLCCGSARRMDDGAWLISWGNSPWVRAYDVSGKTVFSSRYLSASRFAYRATPVTTSAFAEADVVAAMDYVR